ncbi:MAG: HAMP domain-containing histidine kinase [Clostridiales bacterium]|jgi:signal transduction histidine kinase|nr:HAMP domain-containing histidine kinase [Clostridiales bacterium]
MVSGKKIKELSAYVRKMANGEEVYDIRDNKEGAFSILKSDIYKLAQRLLEQAAVLNEEKAALKDILYDISHQLKTPLTSLTVMADLLETDGLPPEKRSEFLANLQTGLSRMDWLVKSLLKIARLDSGEETLKGETVNIRDIVNFAASALMPVIKAKNQLFTADIDDYLTVVCDTNWTAEALSNILKNACEHTPEGGTITACAGESPLCVWISITDSGEGIDKADIPHLFKRFYKGKSAKGSAGIGLAMSLSVMQKQNGDIEVKTEKGNGSVFTLKFYK